MLIYPPAAVCSSRMKRKDRIEQVEDDVEDDTLDFDFTTRSRLRVSTATVFIVLGFHASQRLSGLGLRVVGLASDGCTE